MANAAWPKSWCFRSTAKSILQQKKEKRKLVSILNFLKLRIQNVFKYAQFEIYSTELSLTIAPLLTAVIIKGALL